MPAEATKASGVEHVAVIGSGLAADMVAAALSHQLPPEMRITLVDLDAAPAADMFYGNTTSPTAYAFNQLAGLSEPRLVLHSDCAFSWGTEYAGWSCGGSSWVQCFHLPLPVIDGVLFHDYLVRQGETRLEPFLLPALAARRGVFMHPPSQAGQQLLARAEYGYQFDPSGYAALFRSVIEARRVRRLEGRLGQVERGGQGVSALRLSSGDVIEADLFVDCTGPDGLLISTLSDFAARRRIAAVAEEAPAETLGAPARRVTAHPFGWRSETSLRGRNLFLTVFDPDSSDEAFQHGGEAAELTLGRRDQGWVGNVVAVGHAAYAIEPITPAPVMLLERDIERLLSLIPLGSEMNVEQREYNRRFSDDYDHAELFTRTFFEAENGLDTPYWRSARGLATDEKLHRKLEMFADRGLLVSYDLEPFHAEDWVILHFGMGRVPRRYNRAADRAPEQRVGQFLDQMKGEVERLTARLPSHQSYMAELTTYLGRNRR